MASPCLPARGHPPLTDWPDPWLCGPSFWPGPSCGPIRAALGLSPETLTLHKALATPWVPGSRAPSLLRPRFPCCFGGHVIAQQPGAGWWKMGAGAAERGVNKWWLIWVKVSEGRG